MPDDTNLLLQSILNEQRETRSEIMDMNRSMVKKEEFASYREEMKELFDDMKKRQEANEKVVVEVKADTAVNTGFRKGLINGIKYIAGATFVAVLGVLGAIIPNFFFNHNSTTPNVAPPVTVSAPVAPPQQSTVVKPLHLKIPKV